MRGLGHLTVRTHTTGFWLALWAAVGAASFAALIPVIFDTGPPVPGYDVVHTLSGVSFAACGIVAWRRRPDSAVGRLLTLAGCWLLLAPILRQIDSPLGIHDRHAGRRDVDHRLRRADPELRDRRPARLDRRPRARRDVLRRPLRPPVRRDAVPGSPGQPAAPVAGRRHRGRAREGPEGRVDRRLARRRVRDRRALALGLAAAPASAAAEPGREPERRALRRLAHHAAAGVTGGPAHLGAEHRAAHGSGRAALGPAALTARARRAR